MFYSDTENNCEITKNVLMKKENYEFNYTNNISFEKKLDDEISNKENSSSEIINNDAEILNKQKLKRKKFYINKFEQYFFIFCCFGKKRKTIKILNLCNDFVQNYMSVENIIFNMVLFENFYKDNHIRFKDNSYLNQIDREIETNDLEAISELGESLNNI